MAISAVYRDEKNILFISHAMGTFAQLLSRTHPLRTRYSLVIKRITSSSSLVRPVAFTGGSGIV